MHRSLRGRGAYPDPVWSGPPLAWVGWGKGQEPGQVDRFHSCFTSAGFLGCPLWLQERVIGCVDNSTFTSLQEKHTLASWAVPILIEDLYVCLQCVPPIHLWGGTNRSCPSWSHTWDMSYIWNASSASPMAFMSTWGPPSAFEPTLPPEAPSVSTSHAPDAWANEEHDQLLPAPGPHSSQDPISSAFTSTNLTMHSPPLTTNGSPWLRWLCLLSYIWAMWPSSSCTGITFLFAFQFQNNMHLLWKIFSITGARDVNVEYILLQHLPCLLSPLPSPEHYS